MNPKVPVFTEPSWDKQFKEEVLAKLKELLEHKHLYQHVTVDISGIQKEFDAAKDQGREIHGDLPRNSLIRAHSKALFKKTINTPWEFATESTPLSQQLVPALQDSSILLFILPTIKIACNHCDSISPPHNSGFRGLTENLANLDFTESHSSNGGVKQLFFFPYQCQSCKGEPLIFMVHRDHLTLRLVGRSQFEQVNMPKFLPKKESKWYRDAVIAFNSGRILAGLFYLRTMVEQYWRRVLNTQGRIPGEDLGDMYAKLLNDEFPQRFTSLKKIYEDLSEKIHAAKNDAEQFEQSKKDIEKHFDALRLFPLKEVDPQG